jgi:cobalt-precorrin 5A hydrolase
MDNYHKNRSIAVWVITPNGAKIASRIASKLSGITVYAGTNAGDVEGTRRFETLSKAVEKHFFTHDAHLFIMAVGITVRMIASLIRSKLTDPAVVAADDSGKFVISLLSGHLGGANALADKIADIISACPVITTATDRADIPSIDMLAQEYGLVIENPSAIRSVSMALILNQKVMRYDPYQVLDTALRNRTTSVSNPIFDNKPGIYIYHHTAKWPENVLVLRPASLVVGVGCNSGASADELYSIVNTLFHQNRLSVQSIRTFATISEKISEPGIQEMIRTFQRPIRGYSRTELAEITNVPTPSKIVEKHMGVKSVCEAAAIKASKMGSLAVSKQKSRNATAAVAVLPCL